MTRNVTTPADRAALVQLAQDAVQHGDEAEAAPVLAAAAEAAGDDAQLWRWSAVLHRSIDQHDAALHAMARAAALLPGDVRLAYNRAMTALEAGLDAVPLFKAAARIAPQNGEVLLGLASARFAAGDGTRAIADLDATLKTSPGWAAGHQLLTQLRYLAGDRDGANASIERALAAYPGDFKLWQALVQALSQGERYPEMLDAIHRGRAAIDGGIFFDANEAVALSELGETARADAMFAKVGDVNELGFGVRQVRHFLRSGRVEQALPVIDRWLEASDMPLMWPYAAAAWRMTGDPRWDWLEGDSRLVSVIDLTGSLPPLDRLAEVLRGLHVAQGQPLDQSVRGGTQTNGVLFTRIEPEIRALRAAIVAAVEAHIAQLPPPDPKHPSLGQRRDRPVRFAGSWSVRLTGGGNHANHVHPMGWFSSALYVSLPEGREGEAGWLTLGEPQQSLGLDLAPFRAIEPQPGRLVLFPSWMWHGTVPFEAGERLTVAFDVAPPR